MFELVGRQMIAEFTGLASGEIAQAGAGSSPWWCSWFSMKGNFHEYSQSESAVNWDIIPSVDFVCHPLLRCHAGPFCPILSPSVRLARMDELLLRLTTALSWRFCLHLPSPTESVWGGGWVPFWPHTLLLPRPC